VTEGRGGLGINEKNGDVGEIAPKMNDVGEMDQKASGMMWEKWPQKLEKNLRDVGEIINFF
jgi:hypothetical protein